MSVRRPGLSVEPVARIERGGEGDLFGVACARAAVSGYLRSIGLDRNVLLLAPPGVCEDLFGLSPTQHALTEAQFIDIARQLGAPPDIPEPFALVGRTRRRIEANIANAAGGPSRFDSYAVVTLPDLLEAGADARFIVVAPASDQAAVLATLGDRDAVEGAWLMSANVAGAAEALARLGGKGVRLTDAGITPLESGVAGEGDVVWFRNKERALALIESTSWIQACSRSAHQDWNAQIEQAFGAGALETARQRAENGDGLEGVRDVEFDGPVRVLRRAELEWPQEGGRESAGSDNRGVLAAPALWIGRGIRAPETSGASDWRWLERYAECSLFVAAVWPGWRALEIDYVNLGQKIDPTTLRIHFNGREAPCILEQAAEEGRGTLSGRIWIGEGNAGRACELVVAAPGIRRDNNGFSGLACITFVRLRAATWTL